MKGWDTGSGDQEGHWVRASQDCLGQGTQKLDCLWMGHLFCCQCQRGVAFSRRQGHRGHPSRTLMLPTKVTSVPSGHHIQITL